MSPSLLFVHGFLGEAADWAALRAALGATLPSSCCELPGHGAAPPVAAPAERWFAAAAERLRATCAGHAAPPVVVGYSMGGRLALYMVLRHPRAASGLVLLGADPGLEDAALRAERLARDRELARQLAASSSGEAFYAWLQRWYAAPLFGDLRHQPRFADLLQRRLRQRPDYLAAALRGLSVAVQPCLWDLLPGLPIPALYVAGSGDRKYRAIAARIAAMGGPWQTAVCAGAGHAVHLEQPDAVADLIRAFAAAAPPARGRGGVTDPAG